jgi:PhnB protein
MDVTPYLTFNHQCREAFEFYARTLGGTIEFIQTHGESPMAAQTPPDWQDAVIHARLRIGDAVLMASDMPPGETSKPQGFSISLGTDDPDEAERVFGALAQDGTVQMPLQQTFWARRFGMLVDRFGTPWMVNCA